MKLIKDFSRIALVAALACSFALTSCKKDEEENCADLFKNVTTSMQAYTSDLSDANCKAVRASMQAYIDAGCDGAEAYKAQLESGAYDCE